MQEEVVETAESTIKNITIKSFFRSARLQILTYFN